LRMTAGLETISGGDLLIGGARMNEVHPRDRDIAMVFQNYALYPTMKVFENIAFSLEIKGQTKDDIRKKVEDAAAVLNLTEHLDRFPKELSGGQRQRVAMGRAMVRDAQVFLFDEPLSNLDAKLRAHMRVEIRQLHDRLETTTIYVTHDQIEAMTMADKIVVLQAGVIEQVGSPLELYKNPRNKFVAGFIGSPKMNFVEGEEAGRLGGSAIGVRPEHIEVSTKAKKDAWKGTVGVAEHLGSDTFIHVHGIEGCDPLTVRTGGEMSVSHGDTVYLTPEAGQIHKFDDKGLRI
ncbi:MAG: ATP-binding cassette domain-containing protein, partial [Pseudomonadota bacterium]